MMDWLITTDTSIFLYLNSLRSGFSDTFFFLFSGRFIWIPMYGAILFTLYKSFNWKEATLYVLAVAVTITLADQLCATFLRPAIERLRPSNPANAISSLVHCVNNYHPSGYGFPSCHAANTFALATLISLIIRRKALTIFLFLWAITTCYSRIYLGAHYPGDLLAGAVIGSIIGWIVFTGFKALAQIWAGNKYRSKEIKTLFSSSKCTYMLYASNTIIAVGVLTIIYIAIKSI